MPEVYSVVAQISPDQVSEGFYTLDDGLLTMVHQKINYAHLGVA